MREVVTRAGSAGSVVAARLSEDLHREVVLVEAGPDYRSVEETPFDLTRAPHSLIDHDWRFMAVGPTGALLPQPRVKLVGAASAVNVCVALRGEPGDYDRAGPEGSLKAAARPSGGSEPLHVGDDVPEDEP
jgi:choline dehydrogenase